MIQNRQLLQSSVNSGNRVAKLRSNEPFGIRPTNNKRTYGRLRFLVLTVTALLLVAVYLSAVSGQGKVLASDLAESGNHKVIVFSGDTLWSIASEHAPSDVSIHQYIYKLKRLNGLNSALIYEGQVLQLP